MRRLVFVLVLALIGATAVLLAPAAGAQTGSLTFDPPTVTAGGGKLFINGTCEARTSGFVISHALRHQPGVGEFAGVPAIAIQTSDTGTFGIGLTIDPRITAGVYSVTLRCGGGLAASGTLTVRAFNSLPGTGASDGDAAAFGSALVAAGAALIWFARRRVRATANVRVETRL